MSLQSSHFNINNAYSNNSIIDSYQAINDAIVRHIQIAVDQHHLNYSKLAASWKRENSTIKSESVLRMRLFNI